MRIQRIAWIAGAALMTVGIIALHWRASAVTGSEVQLATTQPARLDPAQTLRCPDAAGQTLVVITHGLGGNMDRLQGIVRLAEEAYPRATMLAATYPVGVLSNSDPFELAHAMESRINIHFRDCRDKGMAYGKVVLIGYSAGALLMRKAFLYGLGRFEDHPRFSGTSRPSQEWTRAVERIVLLAGMNRGWSLDERRPGISLGEYWSAVVFGPVLRLIGVGGFLRDIERGSPFVANLRLQWIRAAAELGERFPIVVQILGSDDEYVSRDDQMDLVAAHGFYFLDAGKVDHTTIASVELHEISRGAVNSALRDGRERLAATAVGVGPDPESRRVAHYIFVRHGIRDLGEWMAPLETELCGRAKATKQPCADSTSSTGPLTKVDIDRYTYFGMLPFLIPALRDAKVRDFVDQYTEVVAKSANPDLRIDYIGHSHGTFILAKALTAYQTLRVNKAVFANSVVNIGYAWPSVTDARGGNRLRDIRNYSADQDLVVAIFPRLFEKYFESELGSAGYAGFDRSPGVNNDILLSGTHSAGIAPANHAHIADYVFGTKQPAPPSRTREGWVSWLWKFPELGWLGALALGVAFVFACARLLRYVLERLTRSGPAWQRRAANPAAWTFSLLMLGWLLNYV